MIFEGLRDMTALDKKAAAAAVKGNQTKFSDDGFETIEHNPGGKKFITFSKMEEGASVIGEFIEVSKGKFGPEASLVDKDGQILVFVLTAGLSDFNDEEKIKPGQMVKVIHNGLKMGKNEKQYRSFTIMTKKV